MIDVIRFIAQLESVHNEFVSSFLELQTAFLEMLKSGEEHQSMTWWYEDVNAICEKGYFLSEFSLAALYGRILVMLNRRIPVKGGRCLTSFLHTCIL